MRDYIKAKCKNCGTTVEKIHIRKEGTRCFPCSVKFKRRDKTNEKV